MNDTGESDKPVIHFTKHARTRFGERVEKVDIEKFSEAASDYLARVRGREKLPVCKVRAHGVRFVVRKTRDKDHWLVITVLGE
jgi:hypothetical protein